MPKNSSASDFRRFSPILCFKVLLVLFYSKFCALFKFLCKMWGLGWSSLCLQISSFSGFCIQLLLHIFKIILVYLCIPLIYMSIFLPIPHRLDYCSYIISLEDKENGSSTVFFFYRNGFSILFSLSFMLNLECICVPTKVLQFGKDFYRTVYQFEDTWHL